MTEKGNLNQEKTEDPKVRTCLGGQDAGSRCRGGGDGDDDGGLHTQECNFLLKSFCFSNSG